MTLALARELGPRVRVNGVAPGAVLWPEAGNAMRTRRRSSSAPLRRVGAPEDVAGAVLWLLRDRRLRDRSGHRVDGGRSIVV